MPADHDPDRHRERTFLPAAAKQRKSLRTAVIARPSPTRPTLPKLVPEARGHSPCVLSLERPQSEVVPQSLEPRHERSQWTLLAGLLVPLLPRAPPPPCSALRRSGAARNLRNLN